MKSWLKSKRISVVEFGKNTGFYVISDRELAKPIGFFGLSADNELYNLFIEPIYRRKGYATDVIQLLRDNKIRIKTVTSTKNVSMQKLLEKMGFKKWLKYEDKEL